MLMGYETVMRNKISGPVRYGMRLRPGRTPSETTTATDRVAVNRILFKIVHVNCGPENAKHLVAQKQSLVKLQNVITLQEQLRDKLNLPKIHD